MLCKRCRTEIAQNAGVCPVCGAIVEIPTTNTQPQSLYEAYASSSHNQSAQQPRDYTTSIPGKIDPMPSARSGHPPVVPPYPNAQTYQQDAYNTFTPGASAFMVTTKNDAALVAEILLSLVGIFGIGWIMAGKTVIGTIFLVCSVLIYWPIMIVGTFITFGIGLICLGPFAIVTIILNFILLNSYLNRRATKFVLTQQPPPKMTVPPQQR